MIAVANESAQAETVGELPEIALNANWLPSLDTFRTYATELAL